MSKKTKDVHAWVGDKDTAEKIPTSDLDKIQLKFGELITIQKTKGGGIAIFPSASGDRSAFDSFMERLPLEKRRVVLEKL